MTFRRDLDKIEEEKRSLQLLTNEERNAIVWAGRLRGKSFEEIHFFLINSYSNQLPKDYSIKELAEDAGFSDRTRLDKTLKKIINCNLQEFIAHE